ncbi:MAG: hypothetical protein QM764_20900 [Chitinophagaceae bacterium]
MNSFCFSQVTPAAAIYSFIPSDTKISERLQQSAGDPIGKNANGDPLFSFLMDPFLNSFSISMWINSTKI